MTCRLLLIWSRWAWIFACFSNLYSLLGNYKGLPLPITRKDYFIYQIPDNLSLLWLGRIEIFSELKQIIRNIWHGRKWFWWFSKTAKRISLISSSPWLTGFHWPMTIVHKIRLNIYYFCLCKNVENRLLKMASYCKRIDF